MQQIGTVVKRTKSFYYVDVGEKKPLLCHIRGSYFNENPQQNKIAVGDKVKIDQTLSQNPGLILEMLPRRTKLSRRNNKGEPEQVLVSNADTLLIVSSVRSPPFREGLVDRYLVASSRGGLEPFLIISKSDLATSKEITQINKLYTSLGITVLVTSVCESRGLESLRNLMKNRTSILSGHSGVGKSSLISALFPKWKIRIGQISKKSGNIFLK